MAESTVSTEPSRSVQRRAASSARRAPATAASRRASPAKGSVSLAALITATASAGFMASRGGRLTPGGRVRAAGLEETALHDRLLERRSEHSQPVADSRVSQPSPSQPGEPAVHLGHAKPGQGCPADGVFLDESDPTGLVAVGWLACTNPRSVRASSPTCRPPSGPWHPAGGKIRAGAPSRNASRLPPRTVTAVWVGRPVPLRPVKTRTCHTPGLRSRMVATTENGSKK